jgi:cytochrome c oxidase cbb3-type subunit I/II
MPDALLQCLHAHGAVGFFLTAPALGLLYYFLPRAAERPLHSYRLAIVHFWGLALLYGWAAPRYLLDTALPDSLQTVGAVFAMLLWAPAWAGVWNGLFTLRGTGERFRRDPVLKFLAAALVFHGLAALEVPLLTVRDVWQLASYTDWTSGHAHLGGLGWNGFLLAALLYWLVPRLWATQLRSPAAAHAHFYLSTVGLLVYLASAWLAGATQGIMWREPTASGGLTYNFIQTLVALDVPLWGRLAGGSIYLAGFLLLGWNLVATIRTGHPAFEREARIAEPLAEPPPPPRSDFAGSVTPASGETPVGPRARQLVLSQPVAIATAVFALAVAAALVNPLAATGLLLLAALLGLAGVGGASLARQGGQPPWHSRLERSAVAFSILIAAAVLAGPAAELASLVAGGAASTARAPAPYTPLELEGRQVYLSEGCAGCHTQMIRPFLWEVARYGEVSTASDSQGDHPALWGSRRVGPDLARVGGRYPNLWHYQHLVDPGAVTWGSNMPPYAHLAGRRIDLDRTAPRMRALAALGVPYGAADLAGAREAALAQARAITDELAAARIELPRDSAMVALIAYLQRLGRETPP